MIIPYEKALKKAFLRKALFSALKSLLYTLNKKDILPNLQKRFWKFLKASKWVQSLKKKDKKIYETFKGYSHVSAGRTFSCETCF